SPISVTKRTSKPRHWLIVLLGGGESGLLFRRRFLLMLGLPLFGRHAIHQRARFLFFQRDTFFASRFAIPVAQAIAAEASRNHHVDVLHIGALLQVRHQPAEHRRFQCFFGLIVHGGPPQTSTASRANSAFS